MGGELLTAPQHRFIYSNKMEGGFTKRARGTTKSDIFLFKPDKWFKIWFYIIDQVCRKDYKKWKRGENWFTYEQISDATGATKQQIYKAILRMKSEGMIGVYKETRGMTIKVLKYAKYQDVKNGTGDTEETGGRHGGDTEDDTIEEEVKKKRNKDILPCREEVRDYWNKIGTEIEKRRIKKIPLAPESMDSALQESLVGLIKMKYTTQQIKQSIRNYGMEILERIDGKTPDSTRYYNHRFSILQFLRQKNGFIQFLHKG